MIYMEYEEFKEKVMERLHDFYGEDAIITLDRMEKNNGTGYDGLCIKLKGRENESIPIVSLGQFYDEAQEAGEDIIDCVDRIVRIYEKAKESAPTMNVLSLLMDWEKIKYHVYPMLISKGENKGILQKLVSTDFLDLSIIYVIRIVELKMGLGFVKITKGQMKAWGISAEVIHAQAMENLENDGYGFKSMENVFNHVLFGEDVPNIESQEFKPRIMYILSNSNSMYGAAGILNEKMLSKYLGDKSYYILPSSIHETIFVATEGIGERAELDEIVKEVNETQVELSDRLSDHVYLYDGNKRKIEMCA